MIKPKKEKCNLISKNTEAIAVIYTCNKNNAKIAFINNGKQKAIYEDSS